MAYFRWLLVLLGLSLLASIEIETVGTRLTSTSGQVHGHLKVLSSSSRRDHERRLGEVWSTGIMGKMKQWFTRFVKKIKRTRLWQYLWPTKEAEIIPPVLEQSVVKLVKDYKPGTENPIGMRPFQQMYNLLRYHKGRLADAILIETLLRHSSIDKVARVVAEAASKHSTKLEGEMLNKALIDAMLRASPPYETNKVFDILKLDVENADLFQDPLLDTWIAFKQKSDRFETDFVHELLKRFTDKFDDKHINSIFEQGSIQTRHDSLPYLQSFYWISTNRSPDAVAEILKLKTIDADKEFYKVKAWVLFVMLDPKSDTTFMPTLRSHLNSNIMKKLEAETTVFDPYARKLFQGLRDEKATNSSTRWIDAFTDVAAYILQWMP